MCASPGDTLTVHATITNNDPHTQVVDLTDQPVLDLVIGYSSGTTTGNRSIRWSDSKPLTPDLTRLELKPGQSKSIEMKVVVPPDVANIGVSARFIDDPRMINNPLSPSFLVDVANCPGPFGP